MDVRRSEGGRLKYGTFWLEFRKAAERVGLDEVPPHWFRHAVKTWLAEEGIPAVAINELVGHANRGMDGVYIHVTDAMRGQNARVMQERWERARAAAEAERLRLKAVWAAEESARAEALRRRPRVRGRFAPSTAA